MRRSIAHVAVVVRDYDEVITFFTQKLNSGVLEDRYQPVQHKRCLIAFRDHLRTHPDVAREYADLKRSLAETLGHDRHAYMSAKGDFIARVTDIAMRETRG